MAAGACRPGGSDLGLGLLCDSAGSLTNTVAVIPDHRER